MGNYWFAWGVLVAAVLAAGAAGALETDLKPGLDKEREAMVARWKKALASGEQAAVEQTLAAATEKAGVAFGMSDWPRAVAEAAARAQPPVQERLLGHLRQHRALINQETRAWIGELFKRDVLDPQGELVRRWAAAGDEGLVAAVAALEKAAEGKQWDEIAGLLDAAARCGTPRFLPLAAPYLGHENEPVSQAALGVFKTHGKDLGPDLRSPKLCRIWWLQSGQALFQNK